MKSNQKKWEELELKDDFMFAKVMRDAELCKEMLERLLGFQISGIEYPEEQKTIDISYDSRSVRLDVYVEDDKNTVYNVEIQTVDTRELPKRSRYYQGMIDLNLIEKGELYRKLNTSYVIFICTFDLFGKGYYRYFFENLCREDTDIALGDQAYKIFFNTSGTVGSISEETKAFLRYVGGIPSEDTFVKRLQEKVENVRKNEEWRREYMTLLMRDQENREEGRKEGRKEGMLEEKMRFVKTLLQDGSFSCEKIASVTQVPLEKVLELKTEQIYTVTIQTDVNGS